MTRRPRAGDEGVSAVLGTMLMLALMMTLLPGVLMARQAWADAQEAQVEAARAEREAAERAAWCARNPQVGEPACPTRAVMPGYACTRLADADAYLCSGPDVVPPPAANVTDLVLREERSASS